MGSQFSKLVSKNKEWTKCIFAIVFHGKKALLSILHNDANDPTYQGLPSDEKLLYQFFLANKKRLDKLLKDKILKKDQYDLLLPPGKQETSSKLFDITLLVLLIRNFVNIPPPKGGWNIEKPKAGDTSLGAFVIIIRELRNGILHGTPDDFLKPQYFPYIWSEIRRALVGVNYNCIGDFDKMLTDKVVIDLNDGKIFIEGLIKDLRDDLKNEIDQQNKDMLQNVLDQVEKKIKESKEEEVKEIVEPDLFR